MAFFIFIIIVFMIALYVNHGNLKKEINSLHSDLKQNKKENLLLKQEIEAIKNTIGGKNSTSSHQPAEQPIADLPDPQPITSLMDEEKPYFTPIEDPVLPIVNSETAIPTPIFSYDSPAIPVYERDEPTAPHPKEKKKKEESAFSLFLKKTEKQFADNWTGILGTAIMVLGIGYLSIYTALKVSPFFRVLILWVYAGLLIGSYYILKKKEKWEKTGLWLRSAGASLFLFGCFGASQIDALTFITGHAMGYALIGFGIGVNLFIGYSIRQQTFLSLHVVLSMIILCVIPDKTLATFLMAAATCTIGIVLSYKEKWEYHLLVVILAFIIFDIWFNAQRTPLTAIQNSIAILGIVAVAASCMVMQYRKVYENTRFDRAAFMIHLTNWILFATGLILHATGSRFKTLVLFAGAIVCFFAALNARKKKVFWLYHLDGMVAFILCLLSIIMLNEWNVGIDSIACIVYGLTVTCLFLVFKEKEMLLHKIFLGINYAMGFCLIVFNALLIGNSFDDTKISNALATTTTLSLIAILTPVITGIKKQLAGAEPFLGLEKMSLNGMLGIVFSLFVILEANEAIIGNLFYYVVIGMATVWAFLRKRFENQTFDMGRLFFLVLAILIGITLITIQEKSYQDATFALGLAAVLIYNWTSEAFFNNRFVIRFLSILGMNGMLLFLSYKYLVEYEIGYVFTLLGIGLLNHEFLWLQFKRESLTPANEKALYVSYYFFAIIASLFLLSNTYYFTNMETGLVCIGISIIESYALYAKRFRHQSGMAIPGWEKFNLMNSELLLYNALVFGFSCLDIEYTCVYFMAIAIVMLLLFQKQEPFRRYGNYSFFLLIGTILLTIYAAFDKIGQNDKILLYATQSISILMGAVYHYFQSKPNNGEGKYNNLLPYLLNSWIIVLLFIQVQLCYLPLLFMVLALVNFWLIVSKKSRINLHFLIITAGLAILVSVIYCVDKLNGFGTLDWALQSVSVILGIVFAVLLDKKEISEAFKYHFQIVLNAWLSIMMLTQLQHKWLPVYWAVVAIANLFLYHKKISREKNISIVYYLLANAHLAFLSFNYYESRFLAVYLLIFSLLGGYIYLAYRWMGEFKLRNSLLVYPATLSIGCFLYLSFDKGILTFFWILEALGLLILSILLKEKYFRYVSLSLVGLCIVRLMFFDLSNADFLIRAMVLLGVGVVLIVMNSLFKKYKDRFD